jgi:hypothetical protein
VNHTACHRPEETQLYQLVETHCPEFVALREVAGRPLPKCVSTAPRVPNSIRRFP